MIWQMSTAEYNKGDLTIMASGVGSPAEPFEAHPSAQMAARERLFNQVQDKHPDMSPEEVANELGSIITSFSYHFWTGA